MTQPSPSDPDTVAEVAPGEGPHPGSVEYGGSEIAAVTPEPVTSDGAGTTTEAGTFTELPISPDEQVE